MEGDKMRLQGLLQPLKENEKFISILNELKKKSFPIDIVGLSESGKSYIIDAIFSEIEDSLVVVTHNEIEAKNLYDDLSLYSTNVYFLPIREVVFYNVDAISGDLRWARLKVIKEILDNKNKKIIVTSIEAMTSVYTPKEKYINYNINIESGDEVNLKDISNKLIECGYERVEVVEGKGEFSFRGGILDVFPPIAIYPYRIELFGDEVDSIRTFNIESQRSIEKVEVVEIFPAKEVIVDEESKKRANECIIDELNNVIEKSSNKNSEQIQKLSRIVNKNVEMLNEIYTFETIDSYLPFFYERVESFFDYFKGYTFIIDDLKRCEGKLESIYYEFNENYLDVIDEITTNTMKIECFLKADFQEVENQNKAIAESAKKVKVRTKEVNLLPNTLIISEIEKKVVLPYTLTDIKNILKASPAKYTSAQDVINQLYTIPLKCYKNSAISRFREAYRLVRQRDKGTLLQAVDLATELFFNYNLHPAIITACKNSNELDVYLSCLEYNELEDFTSFKIVFQGLPAVSKKAFKRGHNLMNKINNVESANNSSTTNQETNANINS